MLVYGAKGIEPSHRRVTSMAHRNQMVFAERVSEGKVSKFINCYYMWNNKRGGTHQMVERMNLFLISIPYSYVDKPMS